MAAQKHYVLHDNICSVIKYIMKENIEIDPFLLRNEEFWNHLEYHCVRECYGIDAFNLEKEYFLEIVEYYDRENVIECISSIIYEIDNNALENVHSSLFNLYEKKKIFKQRMLNIFSFL